MNIKESERLLLKHLQGRITPQERGILIQTIEESKDSTTPNEAELPPKKVWAWEEVWRKSQLETPNPLSENTAILEKIVSDINQKLGFDENTKPKIAAPLKTHSPSTKALSERREYEEFEKSEFQKRLKKRKSTNSWFAFSVVIVFAVGLSFALNYLNNYLNLQPKDWKEKTLSDSSSVKYTTDSRFVYPTEFRANERAVQLVGLAELDVKKNLVSFVLDAGSFRVTTKEGQFVVSNQDSLFVFVKKGTATIYSTSDTLARLKENQMLQYYPKISKWEIKEGEK